MNQNGQPPSPTAQLIMCFAAIHKAWCWSTKQTTGPVVDPVVKAVEILARSSVTALNEAQWIFEKVAATDSDYRLKI